MKRVQEANGHIRVIHRHRIGGQAVFARVSQLTYSGERPMAVLSWLYEGGSKRPGVCVELDPAKLRPGSSWRILMYDGVTDDPRFEGVITPHDAAR